MVTPSSISDGSAFSQLLTLALGGAITDGDNEADEVYVDGVKIWPDPGAGAHEIISQVTIGKRWSGKALFDALALYNAFYPQQTLPPVLAVHSDGERRVLYLVGWTGPNNRVIAATGNRYLGSTGFVATAAAAVDIRGEQGLPGTGTPGTGGTTTPPPTGGKGDPGEPGSDGFSPVMAVEADGERRVMKHVAWLYSDGSIHRITAGRQYIGSSGYVAAASAATDIRGPAGQQGWAAQIIVVPDGVRRVLKLHKWLHASATADPTDDNVYLASTGWVSDIAQAVNIRGPSGLLVVSTPTDSLVTAAYTQSTGTLVINSSALERRIAAIEARLPAQSG